LTFGLGNRNCIGQSLATAELDSVLPRLVARYNMHLESEGELDFFLTLKVNGARVRFSKL